MLWAIFASALFSSHSWKPEPGLCNPFLDAKGTCESARILVQIPLMEFQNGHLSTLRRLATEVGLRADRPRLLVRVSCPNVGWWTLVTDQ